ncbi:MAG: prephenate dehydrogenase/arogenate dehydrogenase family protein [Bacteroidales bacterium]|nr:prephenate dehydrogenase/arogenate dehydrogenase family protein [Bacteroidales bacterium]
MSKKVVSVYGYGRFGKLWADILKTDFRVKVFSRRGLKPDEVNTGIEIVDIESLHKCDALFYCVAISSLEDVLIQTRPFHQPGCIYFDTCSVKVMPAMWMKKYLPENGSIIATHPMFGPDSYYNAAERLPMVMSEIRTPQEDFEYWVNFFNSKNMRVEKMTPDEHDKMVAYSQGITHYIGRVLADLKLETTSINTLGYKKLLEIIEQTCNDSWQLFCDLQKYNPYTKKMRKDLHDSIEKIYSILDHL